MCIRDRAKTFGTGNQLKISTDYLIDDESLKADQIIEQKLYEGLKPNLPANMTLQEFKSADKDHAGICLLYTSRCV